jgi:surface antigen
MLASETDTKEESGEIQSSDTLTTGRVPVLTRTDPLTTGRMPVVIPGSKKKQPQRVEKAPVTTKHRVVLHAAVVFVLGVFIFTTLVSFLPLGKDGQALGVGGLLQDLGVMNLVNSNSRNSALVGAQAATATAIMQNDGYDPGKAVSQQYNASLGITGSGDNFPYGQCTYWASYRYHQLTGFWVPWSGNAYQWAYNAPAYGWVVAYTPRVGSIAVFQPGVQYASSIYGHVGIVESINADGSFVTSNMNVYGHAFGSVANLTNYTGYGVSFVYHP